MESTQHPTCSKMELVRIGAKNAIVELSRNPEQLLGDIAPRVRPAGVTLSRSQFVTLKTHQYWISQIATSIFTKARYRGIAVYRRESGQLDCPGIEERETRAV